jgi:probable rRNA maturation factor
LFCGAATAAKDAKNTSKDDQRSLIIFRKRVTGLTNAALAQFVGRAGRALGLRGAINVLVTSSQELRVLNSLFRGKDKATDVLSFPPSLRDSCAGDVAISAQIASQNAKHLGHSAAEEIKILALHGILHLAGYDHERDQGEMEREEARLRKTFGLPVGLIERNVREGKIVAATGKKAAREAPWTMRGSPRTARMNKRSVSTQAARTSR